VIRQCSQMGRLTEVKELIDLHVELFIDLGLRVTFGRLAASNSHTERPLKCEFM